MGAVHVPAHMVEPVVIPDIFATGLGRIEDLGPCLRFTFYVRQHAVCDDLEERVVVCRIIMAKDAVTSAAIQALAASDTVVMLERLAH